MIQHLIVPFPCCVTYEDYYLLKGWLAGKDLTAEIPVSIENKHISFEVWKISLFQQPLKPK